MLRANEKGDGCHSFNEDCIGLKKKNKRRGRVDNRVPVLSPKTYIAHLDLFFF